MLTVSRKNTEQRELTERKTRRVPLAANEARVWLAERLSTPGDAQKLARATMAATCAAIFLVALAVRALYWQDNGVEMSLRDTLSQNMATQYRREARRMLEEGTILFPRRHPDPGDARMIIHPPGYSIVMAASFKLFGESETPLRLLQIICDAAAAVLVFFIAAQLLPVGVALLAAFLMALSPHAAYYSLRLSPDSLAVLPVLFGVYLIVRSSKRPPLFTIAAAGGLLGLSCWLRANGLLLAPLLALVFPILFEKGRRLSSSMTLVAAAFLVVSPITIRNWVVYHHFIPVSVPVGVNLVQGIAELDKQGRFSMPLSDREVVEKDVEWNNRPDYDGHMWTPDGVERDRTRFWRGLAVIRSHPLWYLGAMLRRAAFMVSYNESRQRDWPFNTATVPLVSAAPPFGHPLSVEGEGIATWSGAPADLLSSGRTLSPHAEASLAPNGEAFQLIGGGSEYEDQFAFGPIPAKVNTDFVLALPARLKQGYAAAKVTGGDERVVLASAIIPGQDQSSDERPRKQLAQTVEINGALAIPFSSGDATDVRLVLSNNGPTSVRPIVEVGKLNLFELGPTPTVWTRYPRVIVRGIQRNIFKTERLLPLVIAGIALLAIARRGRALLILLAVPVYYLTTHAPFSTEYRYSLSIHCFLFVMAGVTLYCAGASVGRAVSHVREHPGVGISDIGL